MMKFKFHIGTRVYFGAGCVGENKNEFSRLGKKAFIVTGKSSGKASGALEDVAGVLDELGIRYLIYDKVENNPTTERVKDGGIQAAGFNADFIIGIGGGSPLDAAKAMAVLAVNDMDPLELYENIYENRPLPIIAIPTTAGTGSEVTPYSILTRKDLNMKKSFGHEDLFPRVAFLDPSYIESMPQDVAVNTAVDALSHAIEGYLSKRSTPISDLFAEKSIEYFGICSGRLATGDMSQDTREKLLYMAMLGGMVISHTGTTLIHPIGYTLTYFKDIPHGKANGVFIKEYLRFNYEHAREKIDRILMLLGLRDMDELGSMMKSLMGSDISISGEELDSYASIAAQQKSVKFNVRETGIEDIISIMRNSLDIV